MRKFVTFVFALLLVVASCSAQGLRHSVCIVEPEFTDSEKELMSVYSLYLARAGMQEASRMLGAYKDEDIFGSGVVVSHDGKKYILTNLHVVGYAQAATITFELHDKTLQFSHCRVVQTGTKSDLAIIELPADCDMIALPLFEGEIEEEMSVVAAGFPELAGKPSWQLTRGFISNAQVKIEHSFATHIIQHSAPINPGSSGGPLLYKNSEGRYSILGINTSKAYNREGVELAIGREDIQVFALQYSGDRHKDLEQIASLSGEDWLWVFRQLPDTAQNVVKESEWQLPFEPVLRALAVRDSLVQSDAKMAKHYERSSSHIVNDLEHRGHFYMLYDNYFSINQQVGVQLGYDWLGYFATGIQFSALIVNAMTEDEVTGSKLGYKNCFGAMFGLYLGGQVPIAVGKYILAPRVVQSAAAGPMKTGNIYGGVVILTDTRVGLDLRIPISSCDLVLGAHYNMDWQWTKDNLNRTPVKRGVGKANFNQYLQHGIGITLGVAW